MELNLIIFLKKCNVDIYGPPSHPNNILSREKFK